MERFRTPFTQAIKPFIKTYKIKRAAARNYNDKGRIDNTDVIIDFKAAILPSNERINRQNLAGIQTVSSSYNIYLVTPEYIQLNDVIFTPYGDLKVDSVDNYWEWGMLHATATRINTMNNMRDGDYKEMI